MNRKLLALSLIILMSGMGILIMAFQSLEQPPPTFPRALAYFFMPSALTIFVGKYMYPIVCYLGNENQGFNAFKSTIRMVSLAVPHTAMFPEMQLLAVNIFLACFVRTFGDQEDARRLLSVLSTGVGITTGVIVFTQGVTYAALFGLVALLFIIGLIFLIPEVNQLWRYLLNKELPEKAEEDGDDENPKFELQLAI